MRRKSFLIVGAALSFVLLGCGSDHKTMMGETAAVPVIAAPPNIKDITVYIDSIGTLEPSIFMEVVPQVDGTIIEVLTTEGEWVEKGIPLFKIDPKFYFIKVEEAEAQLAIDLAHLQAVEKKRARTKTLAEKDLVSQSEWEEREAEAEKSQGVVSLDKARLKNARHDLEHCTVLAPTGGRIGKLDAHPGLLVARGENKPLAAISRMNPLLVEFTLTEKEFAKLPKESIEIYLKSLCTESCQKGEISFIDNAFDSSTGLILVRGKVQNSDYALRPGQNVQVRIPIQVLSQSILIPQKAIRYNQEGPYIYVVQPDQTVALRQIILGNEEGSDQVVLKGLEPSEKLVIDGHLRISPGVKVDVKQ